MATVGLVIHSARPRAVALAREATDWLAARGHRVRVPQADADATGLTPWACAEDALADELDVALSFGGDGTMLRAVDLLAADDVPVLGVNVGHLGYLTQVEPEQLTDALERVLAGNYEIEERMMLAVSVASHPAPEGKSSHPAPEGRCSAELPVHTALNEVVVEKVATGHTVRLAVSINDRFFTSYAADGMIVATPTGSTAYSLSARGPIVSPTHRALLLTPVAPHMLFDRTLVLDATETIRLEVLGERPSGEERDAAASISVDGRSLGELHEGQAVVCTAGPHSARLVTFGGRDFHQILKAKFGLADR